MNIIIKTKSGLELPFQCEMDNSDNTLCMVLEDDEKSLSSKNISSIFIKAVQDKKREILDSFTKSYTSTLMMLPSYTPISPDNLESEEIVTGVANPNTDIENKRNFVKNIVPPLLSGACTIQDKLFTNILAMYRKEISDAESSSKTGECPSCKRNAILQKYVKLMYTSIDLMEEDELMIFIHGVTLIKKTDKGESE